MSDFLAWVSFGLQVYSMWPIWPVATRSKRVSQGQSEINLGFYRRRVTWTEERSWWIEVDEALFPSRRPTRLRSTASCAMAKTPA